MRQEILNGFRLEQRRLRLLLEGIDAASWTLQPAGVVNHAAWTVGHLAASMEAIGGELGLAPWLEPTWRTRHGEGSTPVDDAVAYPPPSVLWSRFEDAADRVASAVKQVGNEAWFGPLPDERYRATYPTLAHAVLHILVGHTAAHVGQLGCWLRAVRQEPSAGRASGR
ncbi:MAG: DinB family protein [Planctomycetota bacterium]